MAEVREESASSANVKDLIFAYEHQSSYSEPLETYEGRQRARSIGNVLSYKLFRQPNLEIHNMVDIEKELVKIEAHLNYYEIYEKETHVAFQEQLFNILTNIVSIDPEGHETTIQKKKDLIAETQKLAKILNLKLPFEGNHSYRGVRRTYSNVIKREEAVVSTTSVRTQEHRAVLSSSQSTLNGTYKSEESLNSTTLQDDSSSVDFNRTEERPESATPPPQKKLVSDADSNYIPSVSKLKKFFSFRRNDKSDVKVIPAAYSGVTRSQSLNLKTKKYTVTKREKSEETIKEKDEEIEANQLIRTSSPLNQITNSEEEQVQISLYVEPTKEIEEYREVQNETQHNVSVSKLKGLFEDKQKETDQGLGLLTKKQFSSDFNLPYTEANLGAFRLKRTISGNYMNFAGLLRNVDIEKKSDLNKSKSMSDLKSDGFRYQIRNIDIDDDLSKEVDDGEADDDDNDFEHVSIDIRKEKVKHESAEQLAATEEQKTIITNKANEEFFSGKVGALKKNFENRQISTSTTEHRNEDIKHIIHRTIEPIPNPKSPLAEPVLKVPIQLRTGVSHLGFTEEVNRNLQAVTSTTEHRNEDIKSPIEEPILKVPIQLRTGVAHHGFTEEIHENKNKRIKLTSTVVEPQVPVQPTIGTVSINNYSQEEVRDSPSINDDKERVIKAEGNVALGTVEILKQTFEHLNTKNVLEKIDGDELPIQLKTDLSNKAYNEETLNQSSSQTVTDISSSATIIEKQPIQIATYVAPLTTTSDSLGASTEQRSIEEIKQVLHKTIEPSTKALFEEPVPKVPIQLQVGFSSASHLENATSLQSNAQTVPAPVPVQLRIGAVNSKDNAQEEGSTNLDSLEQDINVSTGSVEALKQTFENLSQSTGQTIISDVSNISIETASKSEEKNPIQIATYASPLTTAENLSTSSNEKSLEEIKQVLHRKIDPSTTTSSEEPVLKIPIQLRMGFSSASHNQEQIVTENLSTSSDEKNLKGIKQVLQSTKTSSEEPVLKVPVQLRVGFSTASNSQEQEVTENINQSSIQTINEVSNITNKTASKSIEKEPIQIATYATPLATSEKLSTSTDEKTIEEIKQVLHRTIEPSAKTSSEEPVLKVPIQLRMGFLSATQSEGQIIKEDATSLQSDSTDLHIETPLPEQLKIGVINDSKDNSREEIFSNFDSLEHDANISSGSVEALKKTFENLSRSNSQENKTLEITETSQKIVLEQPVQLQAALVSSVGVLQNSEVSHISHSKDYSIASIEESKSEKKVLKAPIDLRVNEEIVIYDNNGNEVNSPTVPISLYNGNQLATEATLSRAQIESKTENLMNILESPTAYSTLLSSSSSSQSHHVSSSSELSLSYSEKRAVQHTSSTQVSHRIVSSSSSSQLSELSSRKYFQVLSPSSSNSLLSLGSPDVSNEGSTVTITEVENGAQPERNNFNLNISQENILEELLHDDSELLENVDEKFEEILEGKS